MENHLEKEKGEKAMEVEISERYVNPYTDFGFKKLFALSNLARLLERPKALQERIFTRLFEQAEIARFTPEERTEYVASKKEYWDNYSILTTSYNKGRAEGRAEGELNERLKNARSLKVNGVSIDVIAKSLGLSEEEVAAL